jgi:hypothetical protein
MEVFSRPGRRKAPSLHFTLANRFGLTQDANYPQLRPTGMNGGAYSKAVSGLKQA